MPDIRRSGIVFSSVVGAADREESGMDPSPSPSGVLQSSKREGALALFSLLSCRLVYYWFGAPQEAEGGPLLLGKETLT